MVEQGRVAIATEVSLLLSYLAYPCEGHLETALHIKGYLKNKHNTWLIFDWPTLILTLGISLSTIGQNSTVMWQRQFPLTCRHRLEKTLTCKWWLTATMLEINRYDNPGPDFLYFATWPQLTGYPRSNQPLRPLFLVPSLLPWNMVPRNFGDWDTSVEWWGFPCLDLYMYMATTSQPSLTQQDQNQPWRRIPTQFVTMPYVNLWQWVNHFWHM